MKSEALLNKRFLVTRQTRYSQFFPQKESIKRIGGIKIEKERNLEIEVDRYSFLDQKDRLIEDLDLSNAEAKVISEP
jgi:hypothetical protein